MGAVRCALCLIVLLGNPLVNLGSGLSAHNPHAPPVVRAIQCPQASGPSTPHHVVACLAPPVEQHQYQPLSEDVCRETAAIEERTGTRVTVMLYQAQDLDGAAQALEGMVRDKVDTVLITHFAGALGSVLADVSLTLFATVLQASRTPDLKTCREFADRDPGSVSLGAPPDGLCAGAAAEAAAVHQEARDLSETGLKTPRASVRAPLEPLTKAQPNALLPQTAQGGSPARIEAAGPKLLPAAPSRSQYPRAPSRALPERGLAATATGHAPHRVPRPAFPRGSYAAPAPNRPGKLHVQASGVCTYADPSWTIASGIPCPPGPTNANDTLLVGLLISPLNPTVQGLLEHDVCRQAAVIER